MAGHDRQRSPQSARTTPRDSAGCSGKMNMTNGGVLMKKAMAIALFSTCLRLSAADPHMTADERAKAIRLSQSSQKEFHSPVEGLTDEQWNYKPGPNRC